MATLTEWQAAFAMPAGPEHKAAVDALLAAPRKGWQAGQQPQPGDGTPPLRRAGLPRGRGTALTETAGRRPMRMSTRLALVAPLLERQRRQAVMAAARVREAARRQAARQAAPWQGEAITAGSYDGTLAGLLEARYAALRQARREAAALMATPPNGRALDPGWEAGTATNGAEVLAGSRWQGTSAKRLRTIHPAAPWQARSIQGAAWTRQAPEGRGRKGSHVPLTGRHPDGSTALGREAAAALDRGAEWQPFTPKGTEKGSPRKGSKRRKPDALEVRAAALRAAAQPATRTDWATS